MTTSRTLPKLASTLLVAAGLGLAATAAPSQAKPIATADGLRLTACPGVRAATFAMFVRDVDCKRAIRLVTVAASTDRDCPRRWRGRRNTLLDGDAGAIRDPRVTLCTQRAGGRLRAFTYHLPTA